MSNSAQRGVLESPNDKDRSWAGRVADKSRTFLPTDLKLLPSDATSFEPSQAPPSGKEKQTSATETWKRGPLVAALTN